MERDGSELNVAVVDDGERLYDEVGEAREYVYPSFVDSDLVVQHRRYRHVWPDDRSLEH